MDRLKTEIVERIQNDAILFGKVADALGIKPVSLPYALASNTKLTQIRVIKTLKEHLGIKKDSDLLAERTVEA